MKTKWSKPPPELVDLMAERMKEVKCDHRKMFGYPAYFVNGNMFAGLFADQVFLRFSDEDQIKLIAEYPDAKHLEPVKGRAMRSYMVIPKEAYSSDEVFKRWLIISLEHTRKLPKKN
jgi:TfoX/Sxy family transcriptional regulator of competence genes